LVTFESYFLIFGQENGPQLENYWLYFEAILRGGNKLDNLFHRLT